MKLRILAAAILASASLAGAPAPRAQPEFRAHDIEPKFPGGYAVAAVDADKDGKPDVTGSSERDPDSAWYEKPTGERHLITGGMPGIVNFTSADIAGDAI